MKLNKNFCASDIPDMIQLKECQILIMDKSFLVERVQLDSIIPEIVIFQNLFVNAHYLINFNLIITMWRPNLNLNKQKSDAIQLISACFTVLNIYFNIIF